MTRHSDILKSSCYAGGVIGLHLFDIDGGGIGWIRYHMQSALGPPSRGKRRKRRDFVHGHASKELFQS